ncbi:type VI secretion system protein ImpF [Methylobacterium sp. BE186]|uniref:type VI secretion system baseplate subunit TssE n=1 Tax=Methylobacterium sp. BE186 TaxID=2817715 RepID=UPI002854F056|nr:GPW/gp25 family protein [Methylobacterium sp. BE186]MDR7040132.1 type VI secretion system protein ImpF [Methylobacterium sp. BE186]
MTKRVRTPITEAFRLAARQRDRGQGRPADAAPEGAQQPRAIVGRRSVVAGSISENELQEIVQFDLGSLLNTVNFAAGTDLSDHPEVRRSILNFGFPDTMHRSIDEHSVNDIADEIVWALSNFEPRLVPGSVRVDRDRFIGTETLRIRFVVSAALDIEPLSLPVQFFADLERDTGRIVIQRR